MSYFLAGLLLLTVMVLLWKFVVEPSITKIDQEIKIYTDIVEDSKLKRKRWDIRDTTILVYISKFGLDNIPFNLPEIAEITGRSVGSIEAKLHRISNESKTMSEISSLIISEYKNKSEIDFRISVLSILGQQI